MSNKITEPPITLCKNCKWYRNISDGSPYGCQWTNHLCDAPDLRQPITYCPITGNEEEPEKVYCTRVNNGNCPHFIKRGLFRK